MCEETVSTAGEDDQTEVLWFLQEGFTFGVLTVSGSATLKTSCHLQIYISTHFSLNFIA